MERFSLSLMKPSVKDEALSDALSRVFPPTLVWMWEKSNVLIPVSTHAHQDLACTHLLLLHQIQDEDTAFFIFFCHSKCLFCMHMKFSEC